MRSVDARGGVRVARQCDGAAESVLLSLLGGVKSERHVLGDERSSWRAVAEVGATVGQRE
jgi:hypothetical protein